jgi:hypothetical protein
VETSFATWHPNFWSGFARRGTVVPGGECVKKTAQNCKFSAQFASVFSTVCGSCSPKESCLGSCPGLGPSPFRSVRPALSMRDSFPKERAGAWHSERFSAASLTLLSRPRSLRSPRPARYEEWSGAFWLGAQTFRQKRALPVVQSARRDRRRWSGTRLHGATDHGRSARRPQ